ncbi:hypothetical protein [Methylobacterium sp. SyP6R]|uniref:hypothetical protein n=1 Tax=Methylobacterium sp. SyP6R TaxID=2718876 RepID=UPI001F25DCB9|nr:hypothetical protein [Methylobacterium sp. SyP6R]MCF4129204.1 hypothetical protein [Methylobacterium sp. SyP6R]
MLRDHRQPDPLPFDPLSARSLAMACALIGLVTLLLSERPTPGGVLLAWAGLIGWVLLRVFGRRPAQPARRKVRPRPEPVIEIVEVQDWAPRRPEPVLALPKPILAPPPPESTTGWKTDAHPAVLASVRRRREEG